MSKKQKIKKENPAHTNRQINSDKVRLCKEVLNEVNDTLDKNRKEKYNSLAHYNSKRQGCGCDNSSTGNPKGQKTDLIVLIDTSGSMATPSIAINKAVTKAIAQARKSCAPDLEVTFLGVEGTFSGTVFNQSHRDYITGIHGTGISLKADTDHVGWKSEQGANAIEDLSKYAKWREGACRAIFYISDEELDSYRPRADFANETAVTNAAIAEANTNQVTVFAHHLTKQGLAPQIIQNYKDLCYNTGGDVYFSNTASESQYIKLLNEVICNSCGKSVCKTVKLPNIQPCIEVKWGDSKCDSLEASDVEVMTVTVCNCYANVEFKNFTIASIEVFDTAGKPVPVLPNGTPSIKLHPIGPYCFGDITSCSCVTREFVLICEGAREGNYKLSINGICFDIAIPQYVESECFEFTICKD